MRSMVEGARPRRPLGLAALATSPVKRGRNRGDAPYYAKMISTRRFCGSRTPGAVGTRLSFSPRPLTTIA
jgi:hypothetical protein